MKKVKHLLFVDRPPCNLISSRLKGRPYVYCHWSFGIIFLRLFFRNAIRAVVVLLLLMAGFFHSNSQQLSKTEIASLLQIKKKPLFNGTDIKDWYTFLPSKGKNNDTEKVFGVENGVLHISGKEFGYLASNRTYKNFVLSIEFKWGTKKYPPRDADTTRRDNGVLFYVDPEGKDKVWPKSIEFQIQEGDVGDFWLIDSTTIEVEGKRTNPQDYLRVKKKADWENPHGEWNRVEIISDGKNIMYYVNGNLVNEGHEPNLKEGRILIQSEGAEIYYRKIEIAEIK